VSKTIDSNATPTTVGSRYPTPYDEPCQARFRRRLGDAAGLTQFGVILRAGSCAGFKAGAADAHQLQNRSDRDAVVLEIGTRRPEDDEVFYPDIDLSLKQGRSGFIRGNGEPYTGR
jgi:uncharacterized cupin superfamily protein